MSLPDFHDFPNLHTASFHYNWLYTQYRQAGGRTTDCALSGLRAPHLHQAGVCAAPIYRGCRCTVHRCLPAPPCGSPRTDGGRNSSRIASFAPPRQKATRRPTGPGRSELREAFIFFNTGIKPSRTAEKATTPRVREMTLSSGEKSYSTPLPVVGRGLVYPHSWAFHGTMEYLLGDRFRDGDT